MWYNGVQLLSIVYTVHTSDGNRNIHTKMDIWYCYVHNEQPEQIT